MTNELPIFPTDAPRVFRDPAQATRLFDEVFGKLASVVDIDSDQLELATPCTGFDVAALRDHTLGWLQFFAAALTDPTGAAGRIDPTEWTLGTLHPVDIVHDSADRFRSAIAAGVAEESVVMQEARMHGDGVLAMALGEYLIHGWDLAVSTGREWHCTDSAADAARAFLNTTVAPEFRGPDTGFFDAEVEAPATATALERLLCFAGRNPRG